MLSRAQPARKPWGASAEFGRGARAPFYDAPSSDLATTRDAGGGGTTKTTTRHSLREVRANEPSPRPRLNAKPTTTKGGASKKAPSRRTSKDAKKRSPAASPRKAFGIARDDENEFSFSALAGDGDAWKNLPASPSPSAAGCSLHDLGAEEKRKVAKLIRQVVEYADARKKLDAGDDRDRRRRPSRRPPGRGPREARGVGAESR